MNAKKLRRAMKYLTGVTMAACLLLHVPAFAEETAASSAGETAASSAGETAASSAGETTASSEKEDTVSSGGEASSSSADASSAAETSETEKTGGEEETVAATEAPDAELLVVSFGTSWNDSRTITIGGIENALREAFPNFLVRRAFTSQIIIDKLEEADPAVETDNVEEAIQRAVDDGIRYLVVQPTHLMYGLEYTELSDTLAAHASSFDKLVLGEPLLSTDEDYTAVAEAAHAVTEMYDDGETAIVFMGHGTEAASNADYQILQDTFTDLGYENCYVGTVEAEPSCDAVLERIAGKGYKKVVLRSLMVVAGDHAHTDMADPEDEESWYSRFTKAGYEVTAVLEGLGQVYDIEQLYVKHAQAAAEAVGLSADPAVPVCAVSDGDPEKAILVTSFGTSWNDSRNITIGGIENALREAYPDYQIRRAFTAGIVTDRLAERDGIVIDSFETALKRAAADGIRELVVQPTHLMAGYEYEDLAGAVEEYADTFDTLILADPLLTGEEDFTAVAEAARAATRQYDDGETAIVFMGHGTAAKANAVYQTMQDTFAALGYVNYYVGTVEAEPSCEDVLKALEGKNYKKVILRDLMVVAGDHANNDMADPENPESWYSRFTEAGYEVTAVLQGLGQIYEVQELYVAHTADAIEGKTGTEEPEERNASSATATSDEEADTSKAAAAPAAAAEEASDAAGVEAGTSEEAS